MKNQKEQQDREQLFPKGSYVGNVWGWRFSFISLGIIVFFAGLMFYQDYYGSGAIEPEEMEIFPKTHYHEKVIDSDSLKTN